MGNAARRIQGDPEPLGYGFFQPPSMGMPQEATMRAIKEIHQERRVCRIGILLRRARICPVSADSMADKGEVRQSLISDGGVEFV